MAVVPDDGKVTVEGSRGRGDVAVETDGRSEADAVGQVAAHLAVTAVAEPLMVEGIPCAVGIGDNHGPAFDAGVDNARGVEAEPIA